MFAARNAFMTPPPGAPTITSLSPTSRNNGGGPVTISGTNFVPGATTVRVGGNVVSTTVNSRTQLSCSFPSLGRGSYTVEVITPSGTATSTFTYTWTPYINSISPSSVYFDYASGYTIYGGNFSTSGAGSVYVSNGGYYGISLANDGQLSFNPGALAAGSYTAQVTAPDGWSNAVGFSSSWYPAPSISSVSDGRGGNGSQSGSTITLSGSNFANGTTSVSIGGTAVSASISASSISFSCPNLGTDGTKTITVTTSGSGNQSASTSVYFWGAKSAVSATYTSGSGSFSFAGWVNFVDCIAIGGGQGGGNATGAGIGWGGVAGSWAGGTFTRSSSWGTSSLGYSVGGGGAGRTTDNDSIAGLAGGSSTAGSVTGAGGPGTGRNGNSNTGAGAGNFSFGGVTYTGGAAANNAAGNPPGGGGYGGTFGGVGFPGARGQVWFVARQ